MIAMLSSSRRTMAARSSRRLCGLQVDLRRRQRLAQLVVKFPRQMPSSSSWI
jgi:hypothetical protein